MKKLFFVLISFFLIVDAMAQNTMGKKELKSSLVVYFSATGTTEHVAKELAEVANADIFEITPTQPYSSADLNWHDKQSRSSIEMNNPKSRPEISTRVSTIDSYKVVYIGYPIWWDEAPRVVNTFIESHNLEGKRVVLFATSGGSGVTTSLNQLKKSYQNVNFVGAHLINRVSADVLQKIVE